MSNRTIVEFNHDFAGEIEKDPDGFHRAIRALLNNGTGTHVNSALSRFGVRTVPTTHHSIDRRVVLGNGYVDHRF